MPLADQDNIAPMRPSVADLGDDKVRDIEPELREAVLCGMVQFQRGAFASDGEVAATPIKHWTRHAD